MDAPNSDYEYIPSNDSERVLTCGMIIAIYLALIYLQRMGLEYRYSENNTPHK